MPETRIKLTGALVGATESPYAGFTDRETGEVRPGGVTRRVFLAASLADGPTEIRVPTTMAGEFQTLLAAGFGAEVSLEVELFARQQGRGAVIERRLAAVVEVLKA